MLLLVTLQQYGKLINSISYLPECFNVTITGMFDVKQPKHWLPFNTMKAFLLLLKMLLFAYKKPDNADGCCFVIGATYNGFKYFCHSMSPCSFNFSYHLSLSLSLLGAIAWPGLGLLHNITIISFSKSLESCSLISRSSNCSHH